MESPSSSDTDSEDKTEKSFVFKSRRNLPKHSTPVHSCDNEDNRTEACAMLSFSDSEFEPCNSPAPQDISDDSEESCIPPTPQKNMRYSVINPPTPQPQDISEDSGEPCNSPAPQDISDDSEESCIPPTPQKNMRYSVINPPTPQPQGISEDSGKPCNSPASQHISDDSEESCNFPTPQQEPAEDSDTGQQVAYYDSDDSDASHVDTQIFVNVGYLETDTTLEADDEHSSDTDDEDTYENWCEKYNQLSDYYCKILNL
ncbi:hypothetical protein Pcinc_002884 [Petrolisthes cinctipes]|uniref:Uncharacterized protein n=1 Tax=Petrolisthes cinctipes TaxID=88211 RepID=A0AAE1GKI3_PETCI|nr:hypothetical protein Pcinc_002884 [Petrolisthes cinctipes]